MTSKIETTNELRDDKVLRLVIKYSIPAILAMMVTSYTIQLIGLL